MDTLGAHSQFVDVDTLLNWGNLCEDKINTSTTVAETFQADTILSFFKYTYNYGIHGKVVLLEGNMTKLFSHCEYQQ